MADFTLQIGQYTARVHSLFESTRDYCIRYLTDAPPQFQITVTHEDLQHQQQALREEALQEGLRPRTFSDPFLERTVIQEKLADLLLLHKVLLVHGSTVAIEGKAYLFTAKCGTGKSTHTRLWREVFPGKAQMVNDDKPFLELAETAVLAHGSPWSGKHGLDNNLSVPLQGICILERGTENRIHPITPEDALPLILHQTYHPPEPLVTELLRRIPLWRMTCTKHPEAAQVAYDAMSRKYA